MAEEWKWASARWWKFDFHTHTPASDDYGKGANQEQLRQITPEGWLLNFMRAEVDCIAITDHNSGAWIDPLKQALNALNLQTLIDGGHADFRPLHLFPGVELTVQGNIHILAIFPPDRSTADIDSLLGAVGYRATKGSSDGCSESSAIEVITEIIKAGGIPIPAHVDQPKGLFTECSGVTLAQILDHNGLVAMERIDPTQALPPQYTSKNLNWAQVLGTDSHHPQGGAGQRYPGSNFTWVKMSEPSFDGLRLALIDGALSLKRSDQCSGDPNSHSQIAIESITVQDAKYLGRGQSFICELNPWLNTIIGGRGTGKSTSLEFLRIAVNRTGEIPNSLKQEFAKYQHTSGNRHDEGLLTESAIITVHFRKDGNRFRIRWTNSPGNHDLEQESEAGEWNPSPGDIAQRFPVRIYSQKQIFELSKHPQALLQVVDDAPIVNYRDWKQQWDELISKYLSLRAQEREVQAGLQEEIVVKGQLADVRRKLEVFEKAGHADVLQEYQLRQNQNKSISSWESTWTDFSARVRSLSTELLPPELDGQYFSRERTEDQQVIEAISSIRDSFRSIQTQVEAIASQIETVQRNWKETKPNLQIAKKVNDANDNYNRLLGQLSEVGAADPSIYGELVKQCQVLEEKLKEFDKRRLMISDYQNEATVCLSKVSAHRATLTRSREEFLRNTLDGNPYVQINVVPFGNLSSIEEEFRSLIGRSTGFDRDIGSIDGEEGLLAQLTNDQSLTMEKRVEALKSTIAAIHSNDQAAVGAAKDRRFVSHIQSLTPEQIDRIRCWFPGDSLDVRYSLKDGENFKPVEQGSPGQKTAALLAFILSYGDEPLVLDQPEDDLDNHLIYDLIVMQLRNIKQRRQVIVVTHNANIVVNGDAENVIALDVRSGQSKIVAQGGLQESAIRDEICRIMEGGKEAFEQRYRRINAGLTS